MLLLGDAFDVVDGLLECVSIRCKDDVGFAMKADVVLSYNDIVVRSRL